MLLAGGVEPEGANGRGVVAEEAQAPVPGQAERHFDDTPKAVGPGRRTAVVGHGKRTAGRRHAAVVQISRREIANERPASIMASHAARARSLGIHIS